MYKLYFKLAFQNLLKNYQNTIINLLGLTLGLSSTLFIFLFFLSESNYDNFYDKDIYRINYKLITPNGDLNMARAFFVHGHTLKEKFSNVEDYALIDAPNMQDILINKEKVGEYNVGAIENNFLHFFDVKLIIGDKQKALKGIDDIIVSESFANTFFQNENPLNKEVEISGRTLKIKGVFKDLPSNSSLQYDLLSSIEHHKKYWHNIEGWSSSNPFFLYLIFKDKKEIPNTLEKVNALFKENYDHLGVEMIANFQPIEDIHFHSQHLSFDMPKLRTYEVFIVIISIGIVVLLLSLLNFIVLYTAQKDEEIQALSLMKIYGAHHKDILISTCIEIGLLVLISIGLSLLSFNIILPFINEKLDSVVHLKDYIPKVILFYLSIGVFLILTLSSLSLRGIKKFSLASSLSGQTQIFSSKGHGEKMLLVLQFTMVFILLTVGFIVHQQYQHLLKSDHGFNFKNTFSISISSSLEKKEAFKDEIRKMVGVKNVTASNEFIGNGYNISIQSAQIDEIDDNYMVSTLHVDRNYLDFFDIKITEGQDFNTNKKLSNSECIVNREFMKLNSNIHLGSKVKHNDRDYSIIGIIDNLAIKGVEEKSDPILIMTYSQNQYSYINVKYTTENPIALVEKVRNKWLESNPDYFLPEAIFYDQSIRQVYKKTEGQNQVSIFFGIITLFIALSGLWGITRFSVFKRTKEVSIRRVNGASRKQILILFNQDYLKWILLSFLFALPIAHYLSNDWLSTFPNRITIDYLSWVVLGLIVASISIVTITKICWKVVNTNPSEVLRDL